MKKFLGITLALVLVLALAITSSAALSSSWRVATPYTTGYEGGSVTTAGSSIVIEATPSTNYKMAGVVFKDKVAVNGLEVVFRLTFDNPAGYGAPGYCFGIELSSDTYGDFVAYTDPGVMAGNTMSIGCDPAKTAAWAFYPSSEGVVDIYGAMNSLVPVSFADEHATASFAADITVKFVVNGANIDFYVNGSKKAAYSAPKADVLDSNGKANLAFFCNGYGSAGLSATLKSVNGVAANDWTGTAASGTTTPDTADIDVVVIAAAAIVALAAVAFVYKARKA